MSESVKVLSRKSRAAQKPNGVVIYEGPSRINPRVEIAVIATGLRQSSANAKTGAMVQTWIIVKDTNPFAALVSRADAAICGACPHRPKDIIDGKAKGRTCYVDLRPVLTIWKGYQRGIYPRVATSDLPGIFAGRMVRLGSYGDPAAVPLAVWQMIISQASGHTGYTHQWKSERLRDVTALCQASVDTIDEAQKAKALGLGYFRVKAASEPRQAGEIVCPASAEAGKVTTCAECRMCDGSGRTVVIDAHGIGAANFAPRLSRQLTVMS